MAKEFSRKFYKSTAWKKTREYVYNKYYGLCMDCSKPGQEVHHIIYLTPSNITDMDITLGEDNLILLCRDCHQRRHNGNKSNVREGLVFNEYGELIER